MVKGIQEYAEQKTQTIGTRAYRARTVQEVKKYKYAAHCTYAAGAGQEAEA